MGSAAGRNFWLRLTTASVQCLRLLRALFSSLSLLLQSLLLQIIIGRELCISYRVLVITTAISIVSDCSKMQKGSTFWYWLTQVVLQTGGKNKCDVVLLQTSENGQRYLLTSWFPSMKGMSSTREILSGWLPVQSRCHSP